jgi:GTP-binding protein
MNAEPETAEDAAARKLFSGPVAFLKSAPGLQFLPEPAVEEVAFAGRSNVGKSTSPGRTQELNFFDVGAPLRFRLVDMPGYGFAKAPKDVARKWRYLVNDYLRGRQVLKRALVLVDSRHGLKDIDREVMKMLDDAAVSYRLVLTKADKIKASELDEVERRTADEARTHPAAHPEIIATSSETGLGIDQLRQAVLEAIG